MTHTAPARDQNLSGGFSFDVVGWSEFPSHLIFAKKSTAVLIGSMPGGTKLVFALRSKVDVLLFGWTGFADDGAMLVAEYQYGQTRHIGQVLVAQ